MTRGGRVTLEATQQRMCVGCRKVSAKQDLTRLVVGPQGLVRDARQKLPGRGAYVCHDPACAVRAVKPLGKALKVPGLALRPETLAAVLAGVTDDGPGDDGSVEDGA
jgi:predicted RNA-binding protein YlxR (DUF448 family)